MNHDELVHFFQGQMKKWYMVQGRKFPWREDEANCYERVISEILLQRTKAETVNKYYSLFMNRFPNWKSIRFASQNELEEFLKPIGLFRQRASALSRLSKELEKMGYVLPKTREELEALPAIGQYIASATLMFCFGEKRPLLDANMARVLERFFGKRKMADIRYDPYLQELSAQVVSTTEPERMNWAILDLAALVCRRVPICDQCPLKEKCYYNNDYDEWKNTQGLKVQ